MSIDSVINEAILNSKNKEEIVNLEKEEKALKKEWLENARKRKEKEQELFKIFDDELCQKLKNNLKDKDVDIQDKENVLNVYKNEIKIICVDFNKRKISRSSGKEVFEFCFFYKNIATPKNGTFSESYITSSFSKKTESEKSKEEIQKYRREIKEDKEYISLIENENYEIDISLSYKEFAKQCSLKKIDDFICLIFMDVKDLFKEIC